MTDHLHHGSGALRAVNDADALLPPRVHLEGARKKALDVGRTRLLVTGVVFVMAFVMVAIRMVDLALLSHGKTLTARFVGKVPEVVTLRGDVVDRNGVMLATSLPSDSLFAHPHEIEDAEKAAENLVQVLPDLNLAEVLHKLNSNSRFVWLKRNLTPAEKYDVNRLGIPGFKFKAGERRVYPQGGVASHVLGYTDIDGKGIAGIERYFDRSLKMATQPLKLSIDLRVQSILADELAQAVAEFSAIGAAGVVMDVDTGEVVAMVSLPHFDPNMPGGAADEAAFNRVTKGVYEVGSVFKLFTTAMALDSGAVDLEDGYDATDPIRVARHTISDYHAQKRWLSVPEILVHSSNIGTAKMAMDVGAEAQRRYLGNLGLLSQARIELPEVGAPLLPARWRDVNTMTVSYGHGIAVTPMQVAAAVAAVVNGGVLYQPTLLSQPKGSSLTGERVISEETSKKMRGLMRLVVREGTGKKADVPGYMIGGKTGTADKLVGGRYRRDMRISSFVGAFPINDPRYVVFVLVDEPKGTKKTFNYATGGWVAAPVVGNVVRRAGALLGVTPVHEKGFDGVEKAIRQARSNLNKTKNKNVRTVTERRLETN